MRLPKDFSAFNFELTNSHLLQQKVIPVWHDNDVTYSGNVLANTSYTAR